MRTDPAAVRDWAFAALCASLIVVGISISLYEIFSSIFVGLALCAWLRERERGGIGRVFTTLVLLYIVCNLLSLLRTDYMPQSLRGMGKAVRHGAVCLSAAYAVDSPLKFKRAVQCLLAAACVIAMDSFLQGLAGFEPMNHRAMVPYGDWQRLTGPFRHSNDFAGYLCVVFPLSVGVAVSRTANRALWTFRALTAVALLTALVFTFSRGGWVGAAVGFVAVAALNRNRVLLAAVLLFALWAAFLAPPVLRDRAASLMDFKNNTIGERKLMFNDSLIMWKKSPWIGLGANTYLKNRTEMKDARFSKEVMYAHNGYMQMLVEIGCFGLGAFLLVFLYFFCAAAPPLVRAADTFTRDAGIGLLAGIAAFLVHSGTDTNLHSLLLINLLWMTTGLAWAGRRAADAASLISRPRP